MTLPENWWSEEYGFFGKHYLEGDDSRCGYLISHKQSLEERTRVEVEGVTRLLKLGAGETLLDVPCGYGRHSVGLARKGFQVTGVDVNSVHLARAREAAALAGVRVEFVHQDMRDMEFARRFDAVVNMFYSFGFFSTDAENVEALRRIATSLREGGRFLFHTDVNLPRIFSGKYKTSETRELASGGTLTIHDDFDSTTRRVNGCWIITGQDGVQTRKDYSMRVYDREEFCELCSTVGFKKCEAYGDWEGGAYSPESEDMMIVAWK